MKWIELFESRAVRRNLITPLCDMPHSIVVAVDFSDPAWEGVVEKMIEWCDEYGVAGFQRRLLVAKGRVVFDFERDRDAAIFKLAFG
jgi:hypothetical protein